jgi:alpha-beta hydrolase superfamily lysophospholipase
VLYIHGFVDYFFQTHLAEFFTARGYDFYALDLRKYGRSLLAHQTPNFCTDIAEYYTEIDEAVRIIREADGHDTLLVNGHSTGGLIAALWAHRVRGKGLVQGCSSTARSSSSTRPGSPGAAWPRWRTSSGGSRRCPASARSSGPRTA